jgi:hypothetical protein
MNTTPSKRPVQVRLADNGHNCEITVNGMDLARYVSSLDVLASANGIGEILLRIPAIFANVQTIDPAIIGDDTDPED